MLTTVQYVHSEAEHLRLMFLNELSRFFRHVGNDKFISRFWPDHGWRPAIVQDVSFLYGASWVNKPMQMPANLPFWTAVPAKWSHTVLENIPLRVMCMPGRTEDFKVTWMDREIDPFYSAKTLLELAMLVPDIQTALFEECFRGLGGVAKQLHRYGWRVYRPTGSGLLDRCWKVTLFDNESEEWLVGSFDLSEWPDELLKVIGLPKSDYTKSILVDLELLSDS